MCSGAGDWTCLQPGFPIRKSSDHSLVIDYPRLIADSYVLLRFLVPRHPPSALKNLATKMLASTVKFSTYNRHPTGGHNTTSHHQQGPPTRANHTPATPPPHRQETRPAPGPSGPNNVPDTHPHNHPRSTHNPPTRAHPPRGQAAGTNERPHGQAPTNRCSTHEHPPPHTRGRTGLTAPPNRPQPGPPGSARRSLERR